MPRVYKKTSSKNYNTGKDKKKKLFLLIKTYLPTTLILQWHFSTNQSKLTFENLVIGDVACSQLVYSLRHTTIITYSYASTPLGQSERAYYLSYFITQQQSLLHSVSIAYYL